jgi:hypothetical protein
MTDIAVTPLFWGVRVYHIIWGLLMAELLLAFFPNTLLNKYIGCGKLFSKHYHPAPEYNKETLKKESKKFNRGAVLSAVFWIFLLAVIGMLHACGTIKDLWLYSISAFFYFSDLFCINIWCPFQSFFINNKCCNNCRIYNWGQLMIFSPLIFLPSFWTYSLVFVALLLFIQWEYYHCRYPERFSEITNLNLRCSACKNPCDKNRKSSTV